MNNLNSPLNHHHNSSLQETHHHAHFDPASSHEDFLQQLLSSVPPSAAATFLWPDYSPPPSLSQLSDQSARMRQNQISHAAAKSLMLQQQLLLCRSLSAADDFPSPAGADSTLLNIPQSDYNDVVDGPSFTENDNAFTGLLGQTPNEPHHFHHSQQPENSGAAAAAAARSSGGGAVAGQARPKVRARRGQATDPHSIAERLRRERIAERMKALQEIVPNANKTDKASMLDEIIDYVKFLQLQVKVLSMSRLGGAAPVAPLLGDTASQGKRVNGAETTSTSESEERMTVAERQVAKLMEDDMGAAMQYLQGKGLCLMPISLATAISTSTPVSRSRNPHAPSGGAEPSVQHVTSVSKP